MNGGWVRAALGSAGYPDRGRRPEEGGGGLRSGVGGVGGGVVVVCTWG